jgi:hypothetical protein
MSGLAHKLILSCLPFLLAELAALLLLFPDLVLVPLKWPG